MIPKTLSDYYKLHAPIYDATRWGFLFGRNTVSHYFPELNPKSRILDLGCGTGKITTLLTQAYPDCKIYGIDPSPHMLNRARIKMLDSVTWIQSEYHRESFEENSLDLVITSYSLTMVEDLDAVLDALRTHLKPNGTLIVVDFDSTPFRWFENWLALNHVHFRYEIFKRLNNEFNGTKLETGRAFGGLFSYSIFRGSN